MATKTTSKKDTGPHLEAQRAAVHRYFEKHGDKLLDYARKRAGRGRWVMVGKKWKLDTTGELAAVAIVGDTYSRAIQTNSEFRGNPEALGPYLTAIMENVAKDRARRRKKGREIEFRVTFQRINDERELIPPRPTAPAAGSDSPDTPVPTRVRFPNDIVDHPTPIFVNPIAPPHVDLPRPDQEYERRHMLESLARAAGVPEADIVLLIRRLIHGFKPRELAKEPGAPSVATIKRRIRSAIHLVTEHQKKVKAGEPILGSRSSIILEAEIRMKKTKMGENPLKLPKARLDRALKASKGKTMGGFEAEGRWAAEELAERTGVPAKVLLDLTGNGWLGDYVWAEDLVGRGELVFTDAAVALVEFWLDLTDKSLRDEKGKPTAAVDIARQVLPRVPELWERTRRGQKIQVTVYVPDPQDSGLQQPVQLRFIERAQAIVAARK